MERLLAGVRLIMLLIVIVLDVLVFGRVIEVPSQVRNTVGYLLGIASLAVLVIVWDVFHREPTAASSSSCVRR